MSTMVSYRIAVLLYILDLPRVRRKIGAPFGWTRPRGLVAERLRRGLQILLTRFDSGRGLQKTLYDPRREDKISVGNS
jgi:hypothetical protein